MMGLKVGYCFGIILIAGIIRQVLGQNACPLSDQSEVVGAPLYFYPFGNTTNDTFLFRGDEGGSDPIPLSVQFPFFDVLRDDILVSEFFSFLAVFDLYLHHVWSLCRDFSKMFTQFADVLPLVGGFLVKVQIVSALRIEAVLTFMERNMLDFVNISEIYAK